MPKITQYPAYTSPLNTGSLLDISEFDGMNYTSKQITAQQFKTELGVSSFILEDGDINTDSLDGSGMVRAVTGFSNAIGFNGLNPDKDDATFAQEMRFNTALNAGDVITSIGSDVTLTILDNYFSVTSDNNGFNEGWLEITDTTSAFAYGSNNSEVTTSDQNVAIRLNGADVIRANYTGLGLFGATPAAQQTITGSRGGNAALADLLTKGALNGYWIDSTTA